MTSTISLTTIDGFTILAMDTLSPEQEAYDDLQQVLTAADLVKQILIYSRKQNTNFSPLQPVAILKETFKMFQASLPPNIRLNLDYDEKYHYINADENQIQQIFMNLASNASHAMEYKGGTLSFSVANSPPYSPIECASHYLHNTRQWKRDRCKKHTKDL